MMKVQEIVAKSIIVESKLPDADYVANPYTGCEFGCLYCYASFMGRFVGEQRSNWGNYVYAKVNSVQLAEEQISKWPETRKHSSILLSSVSDPYQGAEQKYELTRGILNVFAEHRYPGLISILTKSPMVLRDIDLIRKLPNKEVGLTITTTDDNLGRFLEVRAPQSSRRLSVLKTLNEQGIPTYAFIGPLLPHFRYQPELLEQLFGAIASAGVKQVFVEHINLPSYIKERLWKELRNLPPEMQQAYEGARKADHRRELDKLVTHLIAKYNLKLRVGSTLYHQDLKKSHEKKTLLPEMVELIDKAIVEGASLQIRYQDFQGNETDREVTPIEWVDFDRRKVRAYCKLREDERTFTVLNITEVKYLARNK